MHYVAAHVNKDKKRLTVEIFELVWGTKMG